MAFLPPPPSLSLSLFLSLPGSHLITSIFSAFHSVSSFPWVLSQERLSNWRSVQKVKNGLYLFSVMYRWSVFWLMYVNTPLFTVWCERIQVMLSQPTYADWYKATVENKYILMPHVQAAVRTKWEQVGVIVVWNDYHKTWWISAAYQKRRN